MTEIPWDRYNDLLLEAAEAALHEAERFVRRLTTWVNQLRLAKSHSTGEVSYGDAFTAAKRSSLDLTKQLAKFRRGEA